MRILHVIYSLSMGGAEKLLTELAPEQRKSGHNVDICVFNDVQTPFMNCLKNSGIKVLSLGITTSPYDIRRIPKLRNLMKKYDVVHAHCTPPQYACAVAGIGLGCRLITTEHSTNNRRRSKRWLKPIENWIYGRYSAIIGCSDKAAEVLRGYLPRIADRIHSIPNGVDIWKYAWAKPGDSLPDRVENEFRLVMVGRFHHPKYQKLIIRAMVRLDECIHLYLVGEGDTFNDCVEESKAVAVNNRVHFLGRRSDIPQILKSVDVMTHSSYWEGLPISILEGMAAGLPIIASDSPGIREIVGNVGFLFDADSIDSFVSMVRRVKDDLGKREELADRSFSYVQKYGMAGMAQSYMVLYL